MSDRKRIAVYYNVGWGGGRRWLYECVSRLSAYHDLDLYCIDRESVGRQYPDVTEFAQHARIVPFRDLPRLPGAAAKLLDLPSKLADMYRFDRASKRLAARIDAQGYDLLFASLGGYTEAPLVLRHASTPSAYYCHEPMRILYEPEAPRPYKRQFFVSALQRRWQRFYYGGTMQRWDLEGTRRAGVTIANSRYTADYAFRAYGVRPLVNYPGVDIASFRPGDEPRERFALTVGELIPSKGYDWGIRALGTIRKDVRPKLVLVCNKTDRRERAYVEAEARTNDVDLEIRERIPDADVRRLYRTASVFLYTPNLEPFGLAAIEAMASGTPVVAVREAGPAETVIAGETGFLCDRDPRQLGHAVLRLLDEPALRERMGAAARAHAGRAFTWERSVEQLQGMLADAAERLHTSKDGSRARDPLERTDAVVVRREA